MEGGGGGFKLFAFLKYNPQKWEKNFYINLETSSTSGVGRDMLSMSNPNE